MKKSISEPVLDGAKVTVKVANTGSRRGDEVMQMYIRDVIFSPGALARNAVIYKVGK